MKSYTAHSEYGALQKVYLKSIIAGFQNQDIIDEQWNSLNYLERPEYDLAKSEYSQFFGQLEKEGCDIQWFEIDGDTGLDSIYCRDASIATDHGIILCNMGKAQRNGEPKAQMETYQKNGEKILGVIEPPGLLEGGDVAWLDQNTLAVAHGYRTNNDGFRQLETLLAPHGITLIQVPLPHYMGPQDVFHLMSIISPIDNDLAVVYSPLMPVFFRNLLLERGFQLIEVPEEEFETLGCNVLALSPRKCIMAKGNPITKSRIEQAGGRVQEYDGNHISYFGGGGPTCLTRPIKRRS